MDAKAFTQNLIYQAQLQHGRIADSLNRAMSGAPFYEKVYNFLSEIFPENKLYWNYRPPKAPSIDLNKGDSEIDITILNDVQHDDFAVVPGDVYNEFVFVEHIPYGFDRTARRVRVNVKN